MVGAQPVYKYPDNYVYVDYEKRIQQLIKEHPKYKYHIVIYNSKVTYMIADNEGIPIINDKTQENLYRRFNKYLKQWNLSIKK